MQRRRRDSTLILPVVIETVIASSPPNYTQHVVDMVRLHHKLLQQPIGSGRKKKYRRLAEDCSDLTTVYSVEVNHRRRYDSAGKTALQGDG